MRRIRVLVDCSHLTTGGGVQVALAFLHNATRTASHEWHAVLSPSVATQFPAERDRELARVVRLPVARWGPLGRFVQIARALPRIEKEAAPDVTFSVFGPAKWRARGPHIVGFAMPQFLYPKIRTGAVSISAGSLARSAVGALQTAWAKRAAMHADYLVVETETLRGRLSEIGGFPAERIFVVRNTYSELFAGSLGPAVGALGKSARFLILIPSAYYPHKNLEIVPEVARALEGRTSRDFEFVLTLPPSGAPWAAIKRRAADLGVAPRVRTTGPIPLRDLGGWYRRAGAVFLPTLLETSTAVYPESFAAGVPLVTSDRDFARELCGEAALLVDPRSPEAAARALAVVIEDPVTCARLVAAGRRVLALNYPTPAAKWEAQLACLRSAFERGRSGRGRGRHTRSEVVER